MTHPELSVPARFSDLLLTRARRSCLLRRRSAGPRRTPRRSHGRPRSPGSQRLSDLVGELSTQSQAFRTKWAAHNVRFHDTGIKRLHHPVVGDLDLTYEAMELSADAGLTMFAYTAEPGSKSEEAMHLLASWAATPDAAGTAHAADRA